MITIPYGNEELVLQLPTGREYTQLDAISPPPLHNLKMELLNLLEASAVRLNLNKTIALACDDNPVSIQVMNVLLDTLPYFSEPEQVKVFIIARNGVQSDIYRVELKHPTIYHNPETSMNRMIGYTSNDTPVEINSDFLDATIRITIGSFLPDPFWSMTGNLTHILPGLTSQRTNLQNTTLALRQRQSPMNTNTKRFMDAKDSADLVSIDMFLNVLTNTRNQITGLFIANSTDELLAVCMNTSKIFIQNINRYHDLIIVGAGGFPLDLTLFDSLSALYSAFSVVRKNGTIVLISKCALGLGPSDFAILVNNLGELKQSQIPCQIGAEKIQFLLELLKHNHLLICSEGLDRRFSEIHTGIEIFSSLNTCMDAALSYMTSASRILIIPDGHRIIPQINSI